MSCNWIVAGRSAFLLLCAGSEADRVASSGEIFKVCSEQLWGSQPASQKAKQSKASKSLAKTLNAQCSQQPMSVSTSNNPFCSLLFYKCTTVIALALARSVQSAAALNCDDGCS